MITNELSLALHVGRFQAFGRNIFHIAPELLRMLDQTDLESIRLADIQLPFSTFYVAFGDAFGAGFPEEPNLIDGAYVSRHPDHPSELEIVLTSRRLDTDLKSSKAWPSSRDRYFYAPFDLKNATAETTFQDLLDAAIANRDITLGSQEKPRPDEIIETEDGPVLCSHVFHETAADEATRARACMPVFRRALSLVGNFLVYLTTLDHPSEMPQSYTRDAPTHLLTNITRGTTHSRRAARQKLADAGYNAIRFVGAEFERSPGASTESSEMSPHWRRGHWTIQAHGPRHSLRKIIWIKPMIVRADRGDPTIGHFYKVPAPPLNPPTAPQR